MTHIIRLRMDDISWMTSLNHLRIFRFSAAYAFDKICVGCSDQIEARDLRDSNNGLY